MKTLVCVSVLGLPDELVVILVSPLDDVSLVVPVFSRPVAVDVGVDASAAGEGHLRHQPKNLQCCFFESLYKTCRAEPVLSCSVQVL